MMIRLSNILYLTIKADPTILTLKHSFLCPFILWHFYGISQNMVAGIHFYGRLFGNVRYGGSVLFYGRQN